MPTVEVGRRQETILYVEDDELTRLTVGRQLRSRGFGLVPAATGEEALGLVAHDAHAPSLALLDLELPGIDGVETFSRLRLLYPDLPAVVCSARLDPWRRRQLVALGVPEECLLSKPCPFSTILAAIQRALETRRQ